MEQLREMCFNRVNHLQVRHFKMGQIKLHLSLIYCLLVKNTIGFNLAAMNFLKQQVEENEQVRLFADLTVKSKDKHKKQKKVSLLSLKSASSVS